MSRIRTFLAVEVSAEIRRRAGELIKRLRGDGDDVKWVATSNLHLTLNFLGDVDDHRIHEVCQAAGEIAAELAEFEIECAGAGAFPSAQRPRTIWIGVNAGNDELCELQKRLAKRLAGLGYPRENRRYQPHLTLGRLRRGGRSSAELARLVEQHAAFGAGRCSVEEVVVFSSRLERGGPVYEVLSRAPLVEQVS